MSTFSGKFKEIPHISVDKFVEFDCDVYFLSHCHTDHMSGLFGCYFQNYLIDNGKVIHASPVSCVILKQLFPKIKKQIVELSLKYFTTIKLRNQDISVVPISAGHCPGSVMFLFKSATNSILYTGDYRINSNDLKKFEFLKPLNKTQTIDNLYLDTTFFLRSYLRFPKRANSLNELCRIIKEWIHKSKNHIIKLVTSAKYGYEYAFMEIFKQLELPVHVNDEIFKFYSLIPEMDSTVTTDGSKTQIHSSCGENYREICTSQSNNNNYNIRVVKVSALRWQQKNPKNGISCMSSDGFFYVCYSTHASYEEGAALIQFLKPKAVNPCVLQRDEFENEIMLKLIEENLNEYQHQVQVDKQKLFKIESPKIELDILLDKTEETKCDILDSPPRKKNK